MSHAASRPFLSSLRARSPEDRHRTATPLELFFDLVIVVAVAQAASGLHHAIAEAHLGSGALTYLMVFFGVWWAWVNFTWFASAYDNDDVVYRLLVLVQLTGALIFAAGIPGFQHGDRTVGVSGYVLMRLALVTLWLRAAEGDPPRRATARRFALGIFVVQVAWVLLLAAPPTIAFWGFWVLAAGETIVPIWAEQAGATPWHAEHVAERYGLFTIIALGESILAASVALRSAFDAGTAASALLPIIVGGLLIVFAFWWLYFEHPGHHALTSLPRAFAWSYTHFLIFSAAAAVGAGLAASVDQVMGKAHIQATAAGASVAVPVAIYLTCLWFLYGRGDRTFASRVVAPLVVIGILLSPFTGQAVLVTGLLMAVLTGFKISNAARHRPFEAPLPAPLD